MARLFSSNKLTLAAAPASASPLSFGCWFNSSDSANSQTLMELYNPTFTVSYLRLVAAGAVAGGPIRFACSGSGGTPAQVNADTSTGYSVNTWTHALAVWISNSSRKAYINGGSVGSNASTRTLNAPNNTILGQLPDGTASLAGMLAEAAIWNIDLSADDAKALGDGASPLIVRPDKLVAYWPILGRYSPEIDLLNAAHNLTVTGATAGNDHPPMFGPRQHQRRQ